MSDDLDAKVAWLNDRSDPTPAIRDILGMPPLMIPESTPVAAETHNVLVDIAHQLRIANLIAFEVISGEKNRAEIRKGLLS
jgi:hypothetical protein